MPGDSNSDVARGDVDDLGASVVEVACIGRPTTVGQTWADAARSC